MEALRESDTQLGRKRAWCEWRIPLALACNWWPRIVRTGTGLSGTSQTRIGSGWTETGRIRTGTGVPYDSACHCRSRHNKQPTSRTGNQPGSACNCKTGEACTLCVPHLTAGPQKQAKTLIPHATAGVSTNVELQTELEELATNRQSDPALNCRIHGWIQYWILYWI